MIMVAAKLAAIAARQPVVELAAELLRMRNKMRAP